MDSGGYTVLPAFDDHKERISIHGYGTEQTVRRSR